MAKKDETDETASVVVDQSPTVDHGTGSVAATTPRVHPSIRIVSRIDGFRRAGRAHSTAPQVHPADTFTDGELAALQAEPVLIVQLAD